MKFNKLTIISWPNNSENIKKKKKIMDSIHGSTYLGFNILRVSKKL